MAFRFVPAGQFRMGRRPAGHDNGGDENPDEKSDGDGDGDGDDDDYHSGGLAHEVVIAHGFWLGEMPVTQAQFAAWKPAHCNCFDGKLENPAERINWIEAMSFCVWLTEQCGKQMPAGHEARLPHEEEWEFACRAGTETEYHTGDGEAALAEAGWYGGFSGNSGKQTQPVGRKTANGWGLSDMHGNVWEWCLDLREYCSPKWVAEEAILEGRLRGGCYDDLPEMCRAALSLIGSPRARTDGGDRCNWPPAQLRASPLLRSIEVGHSAVVSLNSVTHWESYKV